eukprot:3288105-Amphidinium_carterae.1
MQPATSSATPCDRQVHSIQPPSWLSSVLGKKSNTIFHSCLQCQAIGLGWWAWKGDILSHTVLQHKLAAESF